MSAASPVLKYSSRLEVLLSVAGFKRINLSRSVCVWKEKDGVNAPVFLADIKKDTFGLSIGTVANWKSELNRDLAIQYFVEQFPNLTKDLRKILDIDDEKMTLRSFVKPMQIAGLQGKKFGYPVSEETKVEKPKSGTKANSAGKTTSIVKKNGDKVPVPSSVPASRPIVEDEVDPDDEIDPDNEDEGETED